MNDRKKMQKALYEYCKSDEFQQAAHEETIKIKYKRNKAQSTAGVKLKSHPIDKISGYLVFTEFWKVLNKKSELPRAQRDIIYVIGFKCLQNKFGNNGQLRG